MLQSTALQILIPGEYEDSRIPSVKSSVYIKRSEKITQIRTI